ncbi:hypothetical protein T265_05593 [Opisthorchis viverrini]|uniref:Uncharacterized protein n=1 Tax=Opisthorchis viverrini TaxID=6198 RepID=A0A074ZJY0_OPIVI|nr:hypothetical protein T265_05593 [Opisthorchis viverrini]KER27346.1 hypothetical protein T265_05593 [Opisthorchis viverrini]
MVSLFYRTIDSSIASLGPMSPKQLPNPVGARSQTYVKAVIRKTKRTKSKVFSTRSRRSYLSKLVVAVLLWAVDFGSTSREGKTLSFRGEKATGCFFVIVLLSLMNTLSVRTVENRQEDWNSSFLLGSVYLFRDLFCPVSKTCTAIAESLTSVWYSSAFLGGLELHTRIGEHKRINRPPRNAEEYQTLVKDSAMVIHALDKHIKKLQRIITPDPWFLNCEIERYNYDHLTSTISPVLVKTNTTDMADKQLRHITDTESKLFVLNEKLRKHHPGIRSSVDILWDEISDVIMFHEVDDDFSLRLSSKTFDSSKEFLKRQVHNELPPKMLNKKHYIKITPQRLLGHPRRKIIEVHLEYITVIKATEMSFPEQWKVGT